MKKVLKVMACTMIFVMLLGDTRSAFASNEQIVSTVKVNDDNTIQISIGTGEQQVGYLESHAGNRGPEDFIMYGEKTYILDSVNKKVLVYSNNEWSYNIYIEECRYPGLLCVEENGVYVLDLNQDTIIQYDKKGKIQRSFEIPINDYALYNAYFVKDMYIQNDLLCIEDIFGNTYLLKDDEFINGFISVDTVSSVSNENIKVTVKGKVSNISETVQNISLNAVDRVNKEVVAIANELYSVNNLLRCNTNICLYDESGTLSKYYSVDLSNWYAEPNNYIEVEDDVTYIMECQEDKVIIKNVDFTTVSSSQDKPYGKVTESKTKNASVKATSKEAITEFSREEVIERAAEMAQITWRVQAGHKLVRDGYSAVVTVPDIVQNAQIGAIITGIPYCWGGYFGYDSQGGKKFLDYIYQNSSDGELYTAGNKFIDEMKGYKDHTIGLDCSGYVSSAYGLAWKYGTGTFANNCTPIGKEDMQMGDIFCAVGNHVILFYYYSNGYYLCFDCAIDTERTVYRPWTTSALDGYSCYTPW